MSFLSNFIGFKTFIHIPFQLVYISLSISKSIHISLSLSQSIHIFPPSKFVHISFSQLVQISISLIVSSCLSISLSLFMSLYLSQSVPISLSFLVGLCLFLSISSYLSLSIGSHIYLYKSVLWMCPWCNCYRRRKWTRRNEFKFWTRLIAFHIALIPLGKVWIQLFSLQLWVNSRTD